MVDWISLKGALGGKAPDGSLVSMGRLDEAVSRCEAAGGMRMMIELLPDPGMGWRYWEGDLTVPGNLDVDVALVVGGDLVVEGTYHDYKGPFGHVIVLGDLIAENVLTWNYLGVAGDVRASGLVYACYNDFVVEVAGCIRARAMINSDKDVRYRELEVESYASSFSVSRGDNALRVFDPELMLVAFKDWGPGEHYDPAYDIILPPYEGVCERVEEGLPLFRDRLGAEDVPEIVTGLLAEDPDALDADYEDSLLRLLAAQRSEEKAAAEAPYVAPSTEEVMGWLASEEAHERRRGLELDGVLNLEMFEALSRDEDDYTREKCAERLVKEALWERTRKLSSDEIERLATALAADEVPRVRVAAVGALSVGEQEQAADSAFAALKNLGDGDDERTSRQLLQQLARLTPSESLQQRLLDHGDYEFALDVASNASLAPAVQGRIADLLEPYLQLKRAARDPEDETVDRMGMALAQLVENPNVVEEIPLRIARGSTAVTERTYLRRAWGGLLDPSPEVLGVMEQFEDEELRYDWPEFVLEARRAPAEMVRRALVEALAQEYDDSVDVASIPVETPAAFFSALAESENENLWRAAAANEGTPHVALQTLLPKWKAAELDEARIFGHGSWPLDDLRAAVPDGPPEKIAGLSLHPAATDEDLVKATARLAELGDPLSSQRTAYKRLSHRKRRTRA